MTHFHGEDGKMLCGREYVDGLTRRATEDNLISQWSGERREECCGTCLKALVKLHGTGNMMHTLRMSEPVYRAKHFAKHNGGKLP